MADVIICVGSAAEFVDAGRKFVFENAGAYIDSPHGRRTGVRRGNGMGFMYWWRMTHAMASSPVELRRLSPDKVNGDKVAHACEAR